MVSLYRIWAHDLQQRNSVTVALTPTLSIAGERCTRLVRLDPHNGLVLWEARVRGRWGYDVVASVSFVVYANHPFVTSVQCFDVRNGEPLWERPIRPLPCSVTIHTHHVFVGSSDGLYCLDGETGETVWLSMGGQTVIGRWGVAAKTAQGVILLDERDGTPREQFPFPDEPLDQFHHQPLPHHGSSLLFLSRHGAMYTLDPGSDATWRHTSRCAQGVVSCAPTIIGRYLFFQNEKRAVCCYDLSAAKMQWSLPAQWLAPNVSAALLIGGRFVMQTERGHLVVVNQNGDVLAQKTVAKRITTGILALPNDMIIFGTQGEIVAYQVTT